MESSGQQPSALNFLKVLGTLREWEICSPDVTAAVEFGREKVVNMPVDTYEAWFQSQFPRVIRPQTAPPLKMDKTIEDQEDLPLTEQAKSIGYTSVSSSRTSSAVRR